VLAGGLDKSPANGIKARSIFDLFFLSTNYTQNFKIRQIIWVLDVFCGFDITIYQIHRKAIEVI